MTWKGHNIHSYTPEVCKIVDHHIIELESLYGNKLDPNTFTSILKELFDKYGNKVAYSNFRNMYNIRTGWITDPELPRLNSAIVLQATWERIKKKNDESLYKHFGETLDQIGCTCITGISIRLLMDYIAIV